MAKLYPPQIEGTIPAFYGNIIAVPYLMNKTVSLSEIDGFKLQFKSIMTNQVLGVFNSLSGYNNSSVSFDVSFIERTIQKENGDTATEKISTDNWLKIGQLYKVQLAYVKKDTKEIGYYSTVGIVKYTNAPEVSIEGFETSGTNMPKTHEYIGVYKNNDASEKAYSYRFDIYNSKNELYETSGDLLHNYEAEDAGDKWVGKKGLVDEETYFIQYSVVTINKMVCKSAKYKLGAGLSIYPDFDIDIKAMVNEEDGYIELQFAGSGIDKGKEEIVIGSFVITRASSLDDFTEWTEINRFALMSKRPSSYSFKDFTIQHGVTYKYAIQQYNIENSIFSTKNYSNEVKSAFEHAYISDGERQLKIKFNPKISSFKTNIQESKLDTLGGKYPFFFRNKNLEYKEFPISGLISYLSDENYFFLKNEELQLIADNQRTTNLEDYNIAAERIFKMKVLDFLTDGKPKLFRSPAEGNYIVRLMNTSLTPNDTVGRMLHTFNSTAYQISDYNSQKLNEYGFIQISEPETTQMRFKTILAKDLSGTGMKSIGSENNIYSIKCEDFLPGSKIKITYNDQSKSESEIVISYTGCYEANFDLPPKQVAVSAGLLQGQITYSYKEDKLNTFDLYSGIKSADKPLIQFIGSTNEKDIKVFRGYLYTQKDEIDEKLTNTYILNERLPLEDIKHRVLSYKFLHASKRETINIIKKDKDYYLNEKKITENDLNPLYLYKFQDEGVEKYIDGNLGFVPIFEKTDLSYCIKIDDEAIDLDIIYDFSMENLPSNCQIIGGLGTIIEVSVKRVEFIYSIEAEKEFADHCKGNYNKLFDQIMSTEKFKIRPSTDLVNGIMLLPFNENNNNESALTKQGEYIYEYGLEETSTKLVGETVEQTSTKDITKYNNLLATTDGANITYTLQNYSLTRKVLDNAYYVESLSEPNMNNIINWLQNHQKPIRFKGTVDFTLPNNYSPQTKEDLYSKITKITIGYNYDKTDYMAKNKIKNIGWGLYAERSWSVNTIRNNKECNLDDNNRNSGYKFDLIFQPWEKYKMCNISNIFIRPIRGRKMEGLWNTNTGIINYAEIKFELHIDDDKSYKIIDGSGEIEIENNKNNKECLQQEYYRAYEYYLEILKMKLEEKYGNIYDTIVKNGGVK